ncbi:PREDICTED: uncharacterized protein LOC106125010 [Papilio xuthus]|uniref:Uncharacterized protein LOC106125010 n=1 Tax=Papilio xuthus TaxID=66420 RepID=A0AAJ6ZRA4_PAPXU|nr:PREDICTED: uncharacterized protein LOC106125010 [Papilio xuthus]
MYIYLLIFMKLVGCYCYAGYDLFQGFNIEDISRRVSSSITTTSTVIANSTNMDKTSMSNDTINKINQTKCMEEERPENIGTFEVPTQRDIVTMMKTMLHTSFTAHHQKVLTLIKNMKQATKSAKLVENTCEINNVPSYKKCIDQVRVQSDVAIKNLLIEVEQQKMAVNSITEEKICSLSLMKSDPLEHIITLAQENVSLEFALPGFLRSLSACSYYCSQ